MSRSTGSSSGPPPEFQRRRDRHRVLTRRRARGQRGRAEGYQLTALGDDQPAAREPPDGLHPHTALRAAAHQPQRQARGAGIRRIEAAREQHLVQRAQYGDGRALVGGPEQLLGRGVVAQPGSRPDAVGRSGVRSPSRYGSSTASPPGTASSRSSRSSWATLSTASVQFRVQAERQVGAVRRGEAATGRRTRGGCGSRRTPCPRCRG